MMNMRHRPLLSYFLLVYGLAWTIGIPIVFSTRGWLSFEIPINLYWLAVLG
jgi:hypothetical protein